MYLHVKHQQGKLRIPPYSICRYMPVNVLSASSPVLSALGAMLVLGAKLSRREVGLLSKMSSTLVLTTSQADSSGSSIKANVCTGSAR